MENCEQQIQFLQLIQNHIDRQGDRNPTRVFLTASQSRPPANSILPEIKILVFLVSNLQTEISPKRIVGNNVDLERPKFLAESL